MALKSSKILLIILLFTIVNSSMIFSQEDKPVVSKGNIQFYLDKTVFPGNANNKYVEFYLMFYADQLKLYSNNKGELSLKAVLSDESGNSIRDDKEWNIDITIPESGEVKSKVVYDQWNEFLEPGSYKLTVTAIDVNNTRNKGELTSKFTLSPLNKTENVSASELEFVTSVRQSKNTTQFSKGNIEVIPNPTRRYGLLIPTLNFYFELHNLNSNQGDIKIKYSIKNSENQIEKTEEKTMKKPGTTAAIMQSLDISQLRSGLYTFIADVSDAGSNSTIQTSRTFEVIQGDFIKNITALSEEEIEIYSKILSYIGTPSQLDTFKKLKPQAKSEYLIQFWKSLDHTPGTPENEYLEKIQKRFVYAANNFGWSSLKGWQTDMGRICIKYGIPDEVQQFNSEANSLPYQIWQYKENRGYEFVFGDLQGEGHYILLHSNKEGEVSDLNWRELLMKSKF